MKYYVELQKLRNKYNKPFLITEYGGNWNATTPEGLNADLHTGMWSSLFCDFGGTPLLWWFNFIDYYDLYYHYAGFSAYLEGEDFRGIKAPLINKKLKHNPELRILGWQTDTACRLWVYNTHQSRELPIDMAKWHKHSSAKIELKNIKAGIWNIEFWNTIDGNIIKTENIEHNGGNLILNLPEFSFDIAIKANRFIKE